MTAEKASVMEGGSSDQVKTIAADSTVSQAADAMKSAGVGCLVVRDSRRRLAGILSERDLSRRVIASGMDPGCTKVRDVMTRRVVSLRAGSPMAKAEELMSRHRVRHLPVLQGRRVVGIISSRDVIEHQVRTSKAKQQAAEQVAMLSAALRNLDLKDVTEMILREVPRVFAANRALLRFQKDPSGRDGAPVVHGYHCLCPAARLAGRSDIRTAARTNRILLGPAPLVCRRCGVTSRRILIPVKLSACATGGARKRGGGASCICLCEFDQNGFTDEILAYKAYLARDILSNNLSHARMFQEVRRLALTDSLTGAGTRRMLDEALEAESIRANRYRRPYSVAILDIDRFKSINDSLGHHFGDRALAEVGNCLQREKRASDTLIRYGGDELVLLMPETNLDSAARAMERMRLKTKSLRIAPGINVTVSCGVAEFPVASDVSPAELLRRADMALYRAKRLGRDRIETWDGPAEGSTASVLETPQVRNLRNRLSAFSSRSKGVFIQSVWGLVEALEARDPYTRSHSDNVTRYAVAIGRTMGMSERDLATLKAAAMIHDIGKIGVPDTVLRKPGRLTPAERQVMEEHPLIAVRILDPMRFLDRELPIVRHHHERLDGKGYPDRLTGKGIPLGSRVLAAADAFDAMTSTRVYQQSRTVSQALAVLRECSGSQFDPEVTAAFREWVRRMERRLGKPGGLKPADLLGDSACALAAA